MNDEDGGKHHFVIYTDKTQIYAYDPVLPKSDPFTIG